MSRGVSPHKVGEVAEKLMGVGPSASAVSRLNQTLTEQFEAWRRRPLLAHYRILYLDGIHFTVRPGSQTDSTIILTALAVDLEGNKDVLALRACAEEDKDGWKCLLQDLRTRGATQMDLIVTDGHEGLLAAISALFSATPRQRCVVHKQRNVLNAIPHRERKEVTAELAGIFNTTTVVMKAHESLDENVATARVGGLGFDGPRVASRLAKRRPGQPHLGRTRG